MSATLEATSAERLRRWRRLALGVATACLVLGIVGEASGAGLLVALGLDSMAAVVWGVLYGVLALMLPRWPSRVLVAVVVYLLIDGVRLAFAAGDAGQGVPWLALLLRLGLTVPLVRAAFAASEVWEEAAERRRPRPIVARLPAREAGGPSTGRPPRRPPVPPSAPGAKKPTVGVQAPRGADLFVPGRSRASSVDLRRPQASVDAAAGSLRFVVRRCQAGEDGLRVTPLSGREELIEWSRVAALWIRALPPDPPWEGQVVFDIILGAAGGPAPAPVRVFATTLLPPPPGAAPTARAGALRRLAQQVIAQAPGVIMDGATRGFVEGGAPVRLGSIADLAAYEAPYGS